MRRPLVAGNWKMNGGLAEARILSEEVAGAAGRVDGSVEIVVCPPFVFLTAVSEQLQGTPVVLGAQNVSQYPAGAYTGEVSIGMLTDVGCRYVIVGHSERRAEYGETDAQVADKHARVLAGGAVPILCVGETLEQREAGETESVIARQLDAVLDRVGVSELARGVVAYEPVWAIGTGKNASPEQANAVHHFIRGRLAQHDPAGADSVRIVYGGSVKSDNCSALFAMPDIDGGLIGGASLKSGEFLKICSAAG